MRLKKYIISQNGRAAMRIRYYVENLNRNECYAVIGYFYNICKNLDSFRGCSKFFCLFNSFVEKFELENRTLEVIRAVIQKSIQEKQLTLFNPRENYLHPFDYRNELEQNFEEDLMISKKFEKFNTHTILNINLCRCIFAKNENFAKIIALTFFYKETEQRDLDILEKPSKDIKMPSHISQAIKNIKPIAFLSEALKLSDEEAKLLLLAYRTGAIYELREAVTCSLSDDYTDIYAKFLDISGLKIKTLLRPDKKLVSFGLMNDNAEVPDDCNECIFSGTLAPFFFNILKEESTGNFFDINTYSIKKEYSNLALKFLKSDCASNILLYGNPGSGKTEFAKTLAAQSGLKLFIFKNEMDTNGDNNENTLYRLNCLLSIQKSDSIIVVDEAENILQSKSSFFGMQFTSPKKGIVNKMLENSVNKVIWILNYTDGLDDSTLRRFTYSIKFGEMPKTMLQSIAYSKLKNINVKGKLLNELVGLCGSYRVTGASITNMLKTVNSGVNENEEKIIFDVKNMLEANSELLYGVSNIRKKLQDSYELEALNTSIAPNEIVEMVKNAVEYSRSAEIRTGIRMLFYGLSGTGKTEFARYIAEILDKKLILKKASDVLGKYVGESERHIKEAFEEASTEDAILLFDEADSFFANRLGANHSWERTMVNEFLIQMDDFNGLLICTTNIKELMDPAMQRRFHIMTEFKALNGNGIKTLLTKYFSSFNFSQEDLTALQNYNSVTPGDFNSLYGRIRFMPKENISSEYIITELLNMQKEKTCIRKIGFGE
jgi:ATPase, AAA family